MLYFSPYAHFMKYEQCNSFSEYVFRCYCCLSLSMHMQSKRPLMIKLNKYHWLLFVLPNITIYYIYYIQYILYTSYTLQYCNKDTLKKCNQICFRDLKYTKLNFFWDPFSFTLILSNQHTFQTFYYFKASIYLMYNVYTIIITISAHIALFHVKQLQMFN